MGNLYFTPFESEIIGASKKFVYLEERTFDEKPIVLEVPRPIFNKAIKIWFDTKADYCNRFKHFCGVFGSFLIKEYQQYGEVRILLEINDDEEAIYGNVPIFRVISIEDWCDMEHG
jgi:hypothetical protein